MSVLTDWEVQQVIVAVLKASPATEAQLDKAVEWASKARLDEVVLGMVLQGKVLIRITDTGGVTFVKAGVQP